jgi:hypothetical protein
VRLHIEVRLVSSRYGLRREAFNLVMNVHEQRHGTSLTVRRRRSKSEVLPFRTI